MKNRSEFLFGKKHMHQFSTYIYHIQYNAGGYSMFVMVAAYNDSNGGGNSMFVMVAADTDSNGGGYSM